MVSSLAAQLAKGASLNTHLLLDRTKRGHAQSYLFTGREADIYDADSARDLALNGLVQLSAILVQHDLDDIEFLVQEFGPGERTLMSISESKDVDARLTAALRVLGPLLLESCTGKILEWFVRRFRVHEFNVETVLATFFPYHETPHFVKMLSILHIPPNSKFSFLTPLQQSNKPLRRTTLVTNMIKDIEVLRFVTGLLTDFFADDSENEDSKRKKEHKPLIAFITGVILEYLVRVPKITEEVLAVLLPMLMDALKGGKEFVLGTYILLSALSQKITFTPNILNGILERMIDAAVAVSVVAGSGLGTNQVVVALVAVVAPQGRMESWSKSVVRGIVGLQNIDTVLPSAFKWTGVDNLVIPLLKGLLHKRNKPQYTSLLNALITHEGATSGFVRALVEVLVEDVAGSMHNQDEEDDDTREKMLGALRERHPAVFGEVYENVLARLEFGRELFEKKVFGSLASGNAIGSDPDLRDMVVASLHADTSVRLDGVGRILEKLESGGMLNDESDQLVETLITRTTDSTLSIIEKLYSTPTTLIRFLNTPLLKSKFLDTLVPSILDPDISKRILKAHLTFLSDHFVATYTERRIEVFERYFFPLMLFAKKRGKSVGVVWECLSGGAGWDGYVVLNGCAEVVSEESDVGKNCKLARKMASNIMASNDYEQYLEFLVSQTRVERASNRVLAWLVLRELVLQLTGEHQVNVGLLVVELILKEKSFEKVTVDDFEQFVSEEHLTKRVFGALEADSTKVAFMSSVLVAVASIQRPVSVVIDWMGDANFGTDTRGPRFVKLLELTYFSAHTLSRASKIISIGIFKRMITTLANDTLCLLARVWSCGRYAGSMSVSALRHGYAFLASRATPDVRADFQVVLPAVLVALQMAHEGTRQAAMESIELLAQATETSVKKPPIFGYDLLYGPTSDQLQYLSWEDVSKYIKALAERRTHFVSDQDYLSIFHREYLQPQRGEPSKEASFKTRIICFLSSHVLAWQCTSRTIILRCLTSVSSGAKLTALSPLLEFLPDAPFDAEFSDMLLNLYDISAVPYLNSPESNAWDILRMLVKNILGNSGSIVAPKLASVLKGDVVKTLTLDRRLELASLLLSLVPGSKNASAITFIKTSLEELVQDVALVIKVLDSFKLPEKDISEPSRKRTRLIPTGEGRASLEPTLVFIEVLNSSDLPGSIELISQLLETLRRISQVESVSVSEVMYFQQLVLSALENASSNVTDAGAFSKSSLRLEVLCDLIRGGQNSQIFHRSLLLFATMARYAPNSVLRNIMPIFTFMGSDILHRDDEYSFRVVQKTVDSVVPVMVKSLQSRHTTNKLDLFLGSRDFLLVFADASSHIPRHRRTSFFTHLVQSFACDDLIAPMLLLLIDKTVSRQNKPKKADFDSSLSLGLSILREQSAPSGVMTILAMLQECRRCLEMAETEAPTSSTFLEPRPGKSDSATVTQIVIRQVVAILEFLKRGIPDLARLLNRDADDNSKEVKMHDILSHLLSFLVSREGKPSSLEVITHTREALTVAIKHTAVQEFGMFIIDMLESKDNLIQQDALNLVRDRLPLISIDWRSCLSPTMLKILKFSVTCIQTSSDSSQIIPALGAMQEIVKSTIAEELPAIAEIVGPLLKLLQSENRDVLSLEPGLELMQSLIQKLGPRLISHFNNIVKLCVSLMANEGKSAHRRPSSSSSILGITDVLISLITHLPSFWSVEAVTEVLTFCIRYESVSPHFNNIGRTVVKQIHMEILITSMIRTWTNVMTPETPIEFNALGSYFDLWKRTLSTASRSDVLENLKAITKLFEEAFETSASSLSEAFESGISEDAEAAFKLLHSSFVELTIKLNEASFKPILRRLCDWAFSEQIGLKPEDSLQHGRAATLCVTMSALFDYFKSLMTPFLLIMLDKIVDYLKVFVGLGSSLKTNGVPYGLAWQKMIIMLGRSLVVDNDAFWRDDRLETILQPLLSQIPVSAASPDNERELHKCINALSGACQSDDLLKRINLSILMITRSEDTAIKLSALRCAKSLWDESEARDRLAGYAMDTATFIAECAEDDNDEVAKAARSLRRSVETIGGSLESALV